MNKLIYSVSALLLMASCASYTEDQSKAADEFCACMDKEGDFDLLFYDCDMEIMTKYKPETFADDGWGLALEEKCPSVAGKIADGD
ncbi:MAG: hypothetical protein IPM77_04905 [Crocinitomicaceae bacterium]|nr:hypothetical protein [Crocinitomicaceae bacterium]